MSHPPEPIMTSIAAVAGGTLWAMARVFAIVFAPVQPGRRDVYRALVEAVFAIIAALIGGLYVAPYLVRRWEIHDPETIGLVALGVGLCFWQSIPLITALILKYLPNSISRKFGVETPEKQNG